MQADSSHNAFFRRNSRQIARLTMLFVLSLWGFSAYWATVSRQETIGAAENHLSVIVHAVEQYSSSHFKMAEIFQSVTEHWLEASTQADPRSDAKFKAFIGEFKTRTQNLIDLRIASATGALYYFSGDSPSPRDNVADREYFRAAMSSPPGVTHIGSPVISRVTGEWRLPITVRMQRPHHDLLVINASINLSALIQIFDAERPKPDGAISLWKSDGMLLARAPHIDTLLATRPVTRQEEQNLMRNSNTGVFISSTSPIDNSTRLVAFAKLQGFPLYAIVTMPMADVLSPWYRQLALVGVALILVTLAGTLFSVHLANASRLQEQYTAMIEALAMLDPLTGVANRRQFFDTGQREFSRSQRNHRTLSVMMLDLDHFKTINDRWGHPTGDLVLKSVSAIVASSLRKQDSVGRLGGEEFAVILPETAAAEAHAIAERIRLAVEESTSMHAENGDLVGVTLSIGIATIANDTASFDALLSRADHWLYRAKETGRNRVVDDTAQPPLTSSGSGTP